MPRAVSTLLAPLRTLVSSNCSSARSLILQSDGRKRSRASQRDWVRGRLVGPKPGLAQVAENQPEEPAKKQQPNDRSGSLTRAATVAGSTEAAPSASTTTGAASMWDKLTAADF